MAAAEGFTVRGKRLGSELRRLRQEAEQTLEEVAGHLQISSSRLSRIETGRSVARARDIRALLDLYGITDERQRDLLLRINREAQQQGWWTDYEEVLPAGFETYVDLEAEATSIRDYQVHLIPGLLQTEDYARAIIRATRGGSADEIEQLVDLRMRRQELLGADRPLQLWQVLDEAALHRPIGGRGVMAEQLRHLREVGARDNATIQVLPFAKGVHGGLSGSFAIVEFPELTDLDVVYVDSSGGNIYLEKPRDIRRHARIFDHLRAEALGEAESAEFFDRVAKEMT